MNNIYHRYIDIPINMPKPGMFNTPSEFFRNPAGLQYIPEELSKWMEKYGLYFSTITEGFYTAPGSRSFIHTDTPCIPKENNLNNDGIKLNFTWGPNNSTTRWWKIKDPSLIQETGINTPEDDDTTDSEGYYDKVYHADEKDCELMYEQVINRPSILNVGQLHSTYNPGSEGRWTLSSVLLHKSNNRVLKFSEALDIFSGVLSE